MKRLIAIILIVTLIAVLPFISVIIYCVALPKVYEYTYLAALEDKFDRLNKINIPKIIIIGGSATSFGINSEIIEKETGMPVVNFGLYGALGSKAMLELSKSNIRENDIVIFQPEFSSQLYSNFIGAKELLQALESDLKMLRWLSPSTKLELVASLSGFINDKNKIIAEDSKPIPQNVYAYSSFNSYVDISYPRPYNIMPELYDTNNLVEISHDIISEDFIEFFNAYYKFVKRKKANLYISMAPINSLSIINNTVEAKENFYDYLDDVFLAPVFSNINDSIMDNIYFYDTNYHLNDAGVMYRCYSLIGDIKRIKKDYTPISFQPPLPSYKVNNDNRGTTNVVDINEKFFTYEKSTIANIERISIKGLSEEGLTEETLTVPSFVEGLPVYKILSGAFRGAKASTVYLPDTIATLGNGCFGESNVRSVYIKIAIDSIALPMISNKLLSNSDMDIIFYVPKNKYGEFLVDYNWSIFAYNLRSY